MVGERREKSKKGNLSDRIKYANLLIRLCVTNNFCSAVRRIRYFGMRICRMRVTKKRPHGFEYLITNLTTIP